VVDNHQKWFDLTNLEICNKVHLYGGRLIENQNYGIYSPYKEEQFSIAPIDVFRIHHFDNEAKRCSLKWCAFMLNMDVEETPIPFDKVGMTREDILEVQRYRRNDIIVTQKVLELTLGQVDDDELKEYRGKNMIQDRFDVMKETGLKCLNWSDVKIGEEWNKIDYMQAEHIKDERQLYPVKVKQVYGQKFKNFFPSTMSFSSEYLSNFIKDLGNQYVTAENQEFPVDIGNTTYMVKKGGIHSNETHRQIKPQEGFTLEDIDVQGQYPNSIWKLKIYPPHLKETIITQFKAKVEKRSIYKNKASALKKEGKDVEARPYTSIQEMLKLCQNGGYYGKLGQPGSFLEYPEGLLKVCMGNQIEILMLVEMMEATGFQVISGNTDGIVVYFPSTKEDIYNQVCKDWEIKVGNFEMGKLEHTKFEGLWQESINSYIAKKSDGKIKQKGRFCTDFQLHRNKSKRIIPLALKAYFIDKKNPIEFITTHQNIYDFCIAKKTFKQMYYEEQWEEGKKIMTKRHKKLVRYFLSKDGTVLYKRGFDFKGKAMNNHCEASDKVYPSLGQPKVTYFNKAFDKPMSDYNIDYKHYIVDALKRIDKIERTKKADIYVKSLLPTKQQTLF
jgi:hypothetical protein